ncbi:alpha/beta hydrolase [Mucilaginibacter ginsenosidivorans]|uniref:Alpha/beta hydrolase n=1 Tax=Mucilaginibacter ginsenosidivorans TaxID=398053 RepID=A0A5B8V144_9SPHI|nr:alpha/beta hydrolase [Mucilaginibacter ginsenosidivorans]QEC64266.1 alpha/beta hydrolase [Mucilaginibacter ginsenosidivorans]
MSKVFLIPGLGADYRIYKNIDLAGYDVVNIGWIEPYREDTLATYAQKLIDHYRIQPGDIVIGNSLGGMLAVEVAKKIILNKVILISSIKSIDEAPWYFDFFRKVHVYRAIPVKRLTLVEFIAEYTFGGMSNDDQHIFADMLKNTSPVFMKWAIEAILHWDNQIIPQNVYHITGDKDKVFPYKNIKGATIVKGGTHVMIFNKSEEINKWLKNILPL